MTTTQVLLTRSEYDWADDYHTHTRRREAILKAHPEVKRLMTYDPWFKWHVMGMMTIQLTTYYLLSYVNNFWVLLVMAYSIGALLNHGLVTSLHEVSHKQAYGYGKPLANALFGIFANLPIGIPMSATFSTNHPYHHRFLGKNWDADIPTEWEGRIFNTPKLKIVWLALLPIFYGARPFIMTPKPMAKLEILNAFVQFGFNYLVYRFLGLHILLYMVGSTFVGSGLHPVAAHLLTEHSVFFFEQDYLDKLAHAQKREKLNEKLLVPDTFSYYGPMNWFTFNIGYHVEHHDFPSIPSSLLPKVKKIAPEFYEPLCAHTSAVNVLYRFVTDPRINPFSRVRRPEKPNSKQENQDMRERSKGSLNMLLSENPVITENYVFYQ